MAQETSIEPWEQRRLPRSSNAPGLDQEALDRGRVEPRHVIPQVRPSNWTLKVTAAVTGSLLALFVIVHMVGNLKVYQGPESFNAYAHWLKVAGYPLLPKMGLLWIVRGVMGTSLILHIWSTLLIRYRGYRLRGGRKKPQLRAGSFVSRLMLWTGIVLLLFIFIHILDLTTGQANSGFQAPTATESFAYENLVHSMSQPLFAVIYMVAMGALALHLVHGLWLIVTDLGVTGERTRKIWQAIAHLLAVVVALVNMSIPLAVLLGVVS
ncbi:succinate dehydrogenase cytochrome b subunit [Flaviflexus massiliensis]|uniref:succinate dehydrogenase cytochrome b subunit n=1 Tax=Flaviflexus massiliensis TaxID=1522309 RepID=UPI0009E95E4F|nr:succinate dehydrogenase cytochrome b subunit [Flaviflexus massiliensis]